MRATVRERSIRVARTLSARRIENPRAVTATCSLSLSCAKTAPRFVFASSSVPKELGTDLLHPGDAALSRGDMVRPAELAHDAWQWHAHDTLVKSCQGRPTDRCGTAS